MAARARRAIMDWGVRVDVLRSMRGVIPCAPVPEQAAKDEGTPREAQTLVVHGSPSQRYPLRSGRPLSTVEAAQVHAKLLVQQGYAGWMMRVYAYRREDWPAEQWLIDHGQEEPLVGMHAF